MENFYEILGVPEDANNEDIKKSFRKLAKQLHPDISKGSDEQFKKVNHAYKVLSNPESRNDYDKTLKNFRSKTSSFAEYSSNSYTVEGKYLKKMLKEIIIYGHFTNIKIKYKGKKLFNVSYPMALALSFIGLIKAPVTFILLHLGIGAFFTVEVTNKVMTMFDEALKCHSSGNISHAERLYVRVLSKSEYFIPARINLGLLYRQRGENEKAISCFKQVLETMPFGEIGEMAKKHLEELRGF